MDGLGRSKIILDLKKDKAEVCWDYLSILKTNSGAFEQKLHSFHLFSGYFWIVVRNLFGSISTLEKKNEEQNGCCNLNYKLGVQIMAGLLTIFSAVFLVLHHLKVKEMIDAKFERMFKQEPRPEWNLTVSNSFYFS